MKSLNASYIFYFMFRFAEKNEIQQQNKINLYEFRVTGAP